MSWVKPLGRNHREASDDIFFTLHRAECVAKTFAGCNSATPVLFQRACKGCQLLPDRYQPLAIIAIRVVRHTKINLNNDTQMINDKIAGSCTVPGDNNLGALSDGLIQSRVVGVVGIDMHTKVQAADVSYGFGVRRMFSNQIPVQIG